MVFPLCYLYNITSPTEWLVENNLFFPINGNLIFTFKTGKMKGNGGSAPHMWRGMYSQFGHQFRVRRRHKDSRREAAVSTASVLDV